jgi:cystathionine beta-synthase
MLTNTHTYKNILETIGNTPLVEITRIDTGKCRLFVKLENQNPGGSIKDRIALSMINDAEHRGKLKPGSTIVEATAGNTGIGLALVARMKGYKVRLVIPDKMSREKISLLRAMGAEIIMTRSDVEKGHPEYYQDMAERISKETGAYYINQFGNPANPHTHVVSTGPEIWNQMDYRLDTIVAGVGSSGTITGLSHFFYGINPNIEMVLADPQGSVIAEFIKDGKVTHPAGSSFVEGIGEDFIPPLADLHNVKKAYTVSDKDSFDTARLLLEKEGILAGSSSGTLVYAALKYCREQVMPKRVVTFICDSGSRYLSKMFNDYWMIDAGFIQRKCHGDLRDIITHPYQERATICLKPDDTLSDAYRKMKLYDISQLPVVDNDRIIGLIDESDLLFAIHNKNNGFEQKVNHVMSHNLVKIKPEQSIEDLYAVFKENYTAIVEGIDKKFYGIITKIDLINYLKLKSMTDVRGMK